MCKMSRERVSGVGGEKLRWYGIWRYCYCAFCGIYIYLFPAVKIFEDLEDKGYIFKKNEKQNLKNLFLKNIRARKFLFYA